MEYCFYKLLFIHILGFLEFQKSFVPKNSKKQKRKKQPTTICKGGWYVPAVGLPSAQLCSRRVCASAAV
jgi:hypothetical protein